MRKIVPHSGAGASTRREEPGCEEKVVSDWNGFGVGGGVSPAGISIYGLDSGDGGRSYCIQVHTCFFIPASKLQEPKMCAVLRGANSSLSSSLRRREDAARRQAQVVSEEAKAANPEAKPETPKTFTDAEKAAIAKLTVPMLKERLSSLGLPTTGNKAELIDRLLSAEVA